MWSLLLFATVGALAGIAYGYALGRYKVWPFRLVAARLPSKPPAENRHHRPRAEQFAVFQPRTEVVMLGDSLIEGGLWGEIFPGVRIANRGVGGDTTARVLARLQQVEPLAPRKVFLLVGLNDLFRNVPTERTAENYTAIVRGLKATGAKVFCLSVVQPSHSYDASLAARVVELNVRLRDIAAGEGCAFLDLDSALGGDAGLRPENTYDGAHLSAQGYVGFREVIAEHVG